MTGLEVWAPAFARLLGRVTVENSQAVFRDGAWCRLCETRVCVNRSAHAAAHDRELRAWRNARTRELRREQQQRLRLINSERRLEQKVRRAA